MCTVFPLLVAVLLRLSHVKVQLRLVSSAYGHSKMGTDVDGSEGSLTLPQPTCLSAHPLVRGGGRGGPDVERSSGSGSDTAHVCPFLNEMVLLRCHVVGRVPVDVANDAGAEFARLLASQLLCGASPVRSNVDDRTFEEQPGLGYA